MKTRILYKKFVRYVGVMAAAHQEQVASGGHAYRYLPSGEKNPYFTHPLWAAMMILLESKLPEKIRWDGACALLFHDVLEDTSAKLPRDFPTEAKKMVWEMTDLGGFAHEKVDIAKNPPLIRLLKLYDKVATLYEGPILTTTYKEWTKFVGKLIPVVEKEYGSLRIVYIAKWLVGRYKDVDSGKLPAI